MKQVKEWMKKHPKLMGFLVGVALLAAGYTANEVDDKLANALKNFNESVQEQPVE